jgi:hypothetical protein
MLPNCVMPVWLVQILSLFLGGFVRILLAERDSLGRPQEGLVILLSQVDDNIKSESKMRTMLKRDEFA